MNNAILIYPHQLFEENILLKKDSIVFLVEDPLMFTQYRFHKQKLVFHRASMKSYQSKLIEIGYNVEYIEHKRLEKTADIVEILKQHKIKSVAFFDPTDNWLHRKLIKALMRANIECTVVDTPMFVTSKADLDSFFLPLMQNNKKFLMHNFYIWQRKRLNILIDQNRQPTGGKWSHDTDNRKALPKSMKIPTDPKPNMQFFVVEAKQYIEKYFSYNYGETDTFFYPVTHSDAKIWLKDFLCQKLHNFGPYEDAITNRSDFLFHSILSPLLNSGLLTPQYVLDETLKYAEENVVPIPSLEGFIRQIIGWREYIRAVYTYLGSRQRVSNYFDAQRSVPKSFWIGNTGISPIDDTIRATLKYAYAHHILRLMVMGNIMNLCGFKPDDVYCWFMEMYIDAYDWVMVPNVYSMALYADGGLITTKPYISGSSYILKMSDYKKSEWSDIWDSLFWSFVGKHFEKLSSEGRLGFIGVTYKKMSHEKKLTHEQRAMNFLGSL